MFYIREVLSLEGEGLYENEIQCSIENGPFRGLGFVKLRVMERVVNFLVGLARGRKKNALILLWFGCNYYEKKLYKIMYVN